MRNLLIAFLLVALCTLAPALAETPPQKLLDHVSSKRLVHDKKCNFREEKNVECLIYYDDAQDVVWLVLYDAALDITRLVSVKNRVETVVWCRANVCI